MVVLDVPCGWEVHCLSEMQVVSWPAWPLPDPQNVKIIRKDTPDPQNVEVIKKDPHLKKQVEQIQGVQRRAARHKAIHGDSSPAFQTMLWSPEDI